MAYVDLSDITGVPVLMPVMREVFPIITPVNAAGLTVDTSNLKFYRMGRKLFVTGQVAFGGTGTSTGVFALNIGLTSKAYAQSSSITLFKVGGGAGQPGNMTMGTSSPEIYFRKDDASAVADILGNTIGNTSGRFVIFRGSAFFDIEGWDDHEAVGTGVATAERAGLVPAMSGLIAMQSRATITFGITSPTTSSDSCAYFYQLPSGHWMMWFSLVFSWASQSPSSVSVSLTGVPMLSSLQSFSGMFAGSAVPTEAYADVNGLYLASNTAACTGMTLQGTIRLAGKPTI